MQYVFIAVATDHVSMFQGSIPCYCPQYIFSDVQFLLSSTIDVQLCVSIFQVEEFKSDMRGT